jgi:preprotein translocase subunit SecE
MNEMQWNPADWMRESIRFLSDVRGEFRKVTWPTQKEAAAGTVGVLVIVLVITTILGLADVVLGRVVQLILP